MLHLFHGEKTDLSRRELSLLREKYPKDEVVELNGKVMSVTDYKQATESASLFGMDRLVIVENLFSRITKRGAELESFLPVILATPVSCEVVFWEEKEIGKTVINKLPRQLDIALFRPDRILFSFLESLKPGQTKLLLDQFEVILKSEATELIMAMLARQLRYLIIVKDLGKRTTELTPWQLSKFMRQTEYFSQEDLLKLYRQLYDIEVKVKTGVTPLSLTQELKLFLIGV